MNIICYRNWLVAYIFLCVFGTCRVYVVSVLCAGFYPPRIHFHMVLAWSVTYNNVQWEWALITTKQILLLCGSFALLCSVDCCFLFLVFYEEMIFYLNCSILTICTTVISIFWNCRMQPIERVVESKKGHRLWANLRHLWANFELSFNWTILCWGNDWTRRSLRSTTTAVTASDREMAFKVEICVPHNKYTAMLMLACSNNNNIHTTYKHDNNRIFELCIKCFHK